MANLPASFETRHPIIDLMSRRPHPLRDFDEVCQTIEKEFRRKMNDLFAADSVEEEPFATSCIAQIHRATLINGKMVVVKVQHDGIEDILEDLKKEQSEFDPMMIDEWCKEALEALDFNKVAENVRTMSRNFGCKELPDKNKPSNNINVLIPEVIQSTKSVLILEYMDGISLNDFASLEGVGDEKKKIVEEITRAYTHQIFVDEFFNSDPHPGNFLVSKEAPHRPIFLDFGFTRKLTSSHKHELARIFLASTEGDLLALLSALSEMGLKLRPNMVEQAIEIAHVLFRSSTPTNEAYVDAFPRDVVIFARIMNFLKGLSSTMSVNSQTYLDIMRPFAESFIPNNINKRPAANAQWIYNTPVQSDVEAKLRELLVELGNNDKIIGIQVCAYKDGKVIIDTAAGVLGRYDPSPVTPNTLFMTFSVTKGIVAGMLHWLVENGKLKLEDYVCNIWPEFRGNGKENIKVHHVLNHTAGLPDPLTDQISENPMILSKFDECVKLMEASKPVTAEPGKEYAYHTFSFGWLCGGIIERASGKKFQEVLEEVFIHPLNIEGELYIGVPPGVESRLASLTIDEEFNKEVNITYNLNNLVQYRTPLTTFYNMLHIRHGIMPGGNGHCSARALARYYATVVDGGLVPSPHSSASNPSLGIHPQNENKKIFFNPKIHNAFMGVGEFSNLSLPHGVMGLGFKRSKSTEGSLTYFGHSGLGGSTGFCEIKNRFAISITLNKMSDRGVTKKIIELVCSELKIPMPVDFH